MGNIEPFLKACNPAKICEDCSKYVLNSCHSDCKFSDCCECHLETDEIDIASDDSEYSVDVGEGCCHATKS